MSTAPLASNSTASTSQSRTWSVAVIGNPNTGKTTLFNALTGLKQQVGNYPGVTVERKVGTWKLSDSVSIDLIDLPGTYSLAARSPDEMIAVDVLLGQQKGAPRIDAVLAIADASNPERNFYLISQLCELDMPVVIALNMCDIAEGKGITLDAAKIGAAIGTPVVPICANKGRNISELGAAVLRALQGGKAPTGKQPLFSEPLKTEVLALTETLHGHASKVGRDVNRLEAFRVLIDKGGYAEQRLTQSIGQEFRNDLEERRKKASKIPLPAEEVKVRYAWVKSVLADAVTRPAQPPPTQSDHIDKVLTHWFTGTIAFALLMLVVFQSIFSWASPLMDGIKKSFDMLNAWFTSHLADGAFRSLIGDGVIAGVGSVLVFLPQICILFLFIAVLEDCGYMSRAAFLMDRLFSRVGLSGKSFIPMLSSFACAVPGIMATRTIENPRDRLCTILIAPLMSCSARLPVYIILIKSFIPETKYLQGWLTLQGLTLFAMYAVGLIVAVPVAWLLKKTLLKGETPPFLIELPTYKIPDWKTVLLRVYSSGKAFTIRAGTIILAVSIVVWALAYFPRSEEIAKEYEQKRETVTAEAVAIVGPDIKIDNLIGDKLEENESDVAKLAKSSRELSDKKDKLEESVKSGEIEESDRSTQVAVLDANQSKLEADPLWPKADAVLKLNDNLDGIDKEESGANLRHSFFGRMGHAVEPAFKPMGWDWRISMAAIASFPAREVIVATLGTIFNLGGGEDEESDSLRDALKDAKWEGTERPLFNVPVALSIMVFFALCSQCAATLAIIRRETNSWRWPVFSFTYMTVLAYVCATITYQVAMRWV